METVECPYCGHEYEVCQDDGHATGDGKTYREQCPECEKFFALIPSISYSYEGYKADCMNGGEHDWREREQSSGFKTRLCWSCDKLQHDWGDGKGWEDANEDPEVV